MLIAAVCVVAIACSNDLDRDSVPLDRVAEIDCVNGYRDEAVVPAGSTIVLGAVALPTDRAVPMVAGPADPGPRLWSKNALIVSTDVAVELKVPDEWRGRFSFKWGQQRTGDHGVDLVRVPDCSASRGAGQWLAFTGGYYAVDPACVTLIVQARGEEQRVDIGLGAPCAGQAPPVNGPGV